MNPHTRSPEAPNECAEMVYAYGERFSLQRLQDEVADDSSVVHVHSGAKRVEDSGHSHLHSFLEAEKQKCE